MTHQAVKPLRTYNWPVLATLLMHYYPGRFTGTRQVINRVIATEYRLANLEFLLGEIAKALGVTDLPKARPVERPELIEEDIFDLTNEQIESYLQGIGEIHKFSTFADHKKTKPPQLVISIYEYNWQVILQEAYLYGLGLPDAVAEAVVPTKT